MHKKRDVLVALACIGAAYVIGSQFANAEDPAPPPVPWPCYTFADSVVACPGCQDVNNCGDCPQGGICDADTCSRGKTTQDAKPAKEGHTLITTETTCSTTYDCILPAGGCPGDCICSESFVGHSGAPVFTEVPDEDCPGGPV